MAGLRKEMMQTMEQNAGIYRTGEGLAEACAKLAELRRRYRGIELHDKTNVYNTDLLQALELGSMLDCAEAVAAERAGAQGVARRAPAPRLTSSATTCNFLRHSLASTIAAARRRASITSTW